MLHPETGTLRMPSMRFITPAAILLLAGCFAREGNPRNVGTPVHEWNLAGPDYERKVFGPMPSDEVRDFVREKESEGWDLVGYEPASLPEDVMVDSTELDRPAPPKRGSWSPDLPKTMDDAVDPPKKESIPPYLQDGVRPHRQKYLVVMRRWL